MNVAQHKTVNLLKTFFCSSVFIRVCGFNVWPKTTLLLPVLPRVTKSLDIPKPSPHSYVRNYYYSHSADREGTEAQRK